jgi:hypothetical protein
MAAGFSIAVGESVSRFGGRLICSSGRQQVVFSDQALGRLWDSAAKADSSLQISGGDFRKLRQKYVHPQKYSRRTMFTRMAKREVGIYSGVPVSPCGGRGEDGVASLIAQLRCLTARRLTCRTQFGPSKRVKNLPVGSVMQRWLRGRAVLGVTDFHVRETPLEACVDTRELTFFNALIRGSPELASQEMLTMVIASPGNVTDSHSDDSDGSNHCFVGRKLWLVWDTFEGMAAGLEDVERQDVYTRAAFSMATFLELPSARWFLVTPGETLYLPGSLTHKVVTLDHYLGIGSFYVGLPSCLDSLTRWLVHGPLWSASESPHESRRLIDEVARVSLRLANVSRDGSRWMKGKWGFPYLKLAYETWASTVSAPARDRAMSSKPFRALVERARV